MLGSFTPHQRGNAAVLTAMALFVINDALVKLATSAYPTGQVLFVRGVFASLMALALVHAFRQAGAIGMLRRPIVLGRALLEGAVAFAFIAALAHLALANITAILQSSSLIIIALAAALGIERMDARRWAAVVIGFLGVLLIVRPSMGGFNAYSILALTAAVLVACRDLLTRSIASEIPSGVVALGATTGVMLVGVAIGTLEAWQPLRLQETLYLAAAAVAVAGGNVCIIIAYRHGDVSTVSGLRYAVLIFALLGGLLILGEWPDALSLFGAALIVGSGLYALHQQQTRLRKAPEGAP